MSRWIQMVCCVSLFFFHLPVIWQSDRWSWGSVLCCIHTLCVICHYIQVIVWRSVVAWLSRPQLDNCPCFMQTQARNWNPPPPPSPPLYRDNPSIICYIAYYLHNNWCLIFYSSTSRRIEVSFRVSAFILCTSHIFFSYFGQTNSNNSNCSPLYGGISLNRWIVLLRGHKYIIVTMAKV